MLSTSVSNTHLGLELTVLQLLEFDIMIAVVASLAFLLASSAVYAVRSRGTEGWTIDDLNEEQSDVVGLIEENNGEVKQKTVSKELDWSDAKTSRITSELTDLGAVTKIRKDRQNYLQVDEDNRVN